MISSSLSLTIISKGPISKDGHTQRLWLAVHLGGRLSHPLDRGSEDLLDVSTLVPGSDGDSPSLVQVSLSAVPGEHLPFSLLGNTHLVPWDRALARKPADQCPCGSRLSLTSVSLSNTRFPL